MKIVRSIGLMQKISKRLKEKGKTIGFVPTMGYLHQGHLSLMRKSRKDCDITVISIYVNPLQFGPKEDFQKYPRDLETDIKLAKKEGVDYIFIPDDQQMYAQGFLTHVVVDRIADILCGASRPGHFKGVTTVVTKLFNIVCPSIAYFGQKDAQQAIVIKKLVNDLNIPLKIKVLPIIRDPEGLALSSRNSYLNARERKQAQLLYKALKLAETEILAGQRNSGLVIKKMKRLLTCTNSVKIDYIAIVDSKDLSSKKIIKGKILIALAVFIGKIRLIDNIILNIND
ncbi:MAG: pantoate--beta-alanine ligase [Candidatus Omnitrophota bacterium]